MKKAAVLFLAAVLMLSLAACGGINIGDLVSGANLGDIFGGMDIQNMNFASIMSGQGMDQPLGSLNAEQKAEIIASAKEEGVDVTFEANGDVKFKSEDSVVIQKPDGTWVFETEDGIQGEIGGAWSDNEFTKLVPKPDFTVLTSAIIGEQFVADFSNVSIADARAYAEKLKSAGFNVDPQVADQEIMGIVMYQFSASNNNGYRIDFNYAAGVTGIIIARPE